MTEQEQRNHSESNPVEDAAPEVSPAAPEASAAPEAPAEPLVAAQLPDWLKEIAPEIEIPIVPAPLKPVAEEPIAPLVAAE